MAIQLALKAPGQKTEVVSQVTPSSLRTIVLRWKRACVRIDAIGLITVPSNFGPSETMARLEAAINAAGMTVFARVDHGAAATAVHLTLGPPEVVIFGNAKGGTPLMQANQAVGIDLPLKALVYQDASARCGWPITIRSGSPNDMDSAQR